MNITGLALFHNLLYCNSPWYRLATPLGLIATPDFPIPRHFCSVFNTYVWYVCRKRLISWGYAVEQDAKLALQAVLWRRQVRLLCLLGTISCIDLFIALNITTRKSSRVGKMCIGVSQITQLTIIVFQTPPTYNVCRTCLHGEKFANLTSSTFAEERSRPYPLLSDSLASRSSPEVKQPPKIFTSFWLRTRPVFCLRNAFYVLNLWLKLLNPHVFRKRTFKALPIEHNLRPVPTTLLQDISSS